MPGRILLISANRCAIPERVFPLGLTHLQSALRDAGYECLWFDLLDQETELNQVIDAFRPDFVGISLRNIDDVTISSQQTYFTDLHSICSVIRRQKATRIILGGSGFTLFPVELLEYSGADYGIVGEGEVSLPQLLMCLKTNDDFDHIPGLVYKKAGQIVVNPIRLLPFEAKVCLEDRPKQIVARYQSSSGVLNLQTQRGCSF